MRRLIGLILVVTLTIFATLVEGFRNNLWISYRDYRSPYLADLPSGPARQAPAATVMVVLVRGLRLDASRQMPTLNGLREKGGSFIIQNEPPTYRVPAWTTLTSGATAEIHGITTNQPGRVSGASSIFREFQLAGGVAAVVGSQSLGDTLSAEVQRFEVVENPEIAHRDDDAARIGLEVLRDHQNPAQLICIELTALEDTVNDNSGNSAAATAITDSRIKTLLDGLDLTTTALVVLSDRGLPGPNGDGGGEPDVAMTPLVMAGAGVAAHSQGLIQAVDVAPTIAALLGAPLPVHAQGEPALAGLALPLTVQPGAALSKTAAVSTTVLATSALAPLPALLLGSALQLTTFYESWSEAIRQPRFASEMFRAQQAAITSGDAAAYQKFVDDLRARAIVGRDTRIANERSQRLPILVGVGLFLIVVAGVTFTTRRWQPFAGAVLYTAGWYAIFTLARGHLFSLAMFGNSDPTAFLAGLARDSTVLLIVVTAIIALTTGRHDDGLDAITTVLNTVLLIVCVQVGQAAWFYFQWGAQFSWALPDSQSLVAAMAELTQISALSLRIVPELPNLPIPLLIAVLSLIIYTLVRHKEEPGRYGRLR